MSSREQDAGAFDALYLRSAHPLVRQVALLTGDVAAAEAVVVEAYRRAWLRWPEVRELDPAEAWVRTVARRLATRRALRTGLRGRLGTVPPVPHADLSAPFTELAAAVATLPRQERLAVVLHHLADLPVAVLAEELRSSPAAAHRHLSRGQSALADLLVEPPDEVVEESVEAPVEETPAAPSAQSAPAPLDLTVLLHRNTEDLAVTVPPALDVRRSAQVIRRRRRTRAGAVATVAALAIGAGSALTSGGDGAPDGSRQPPAVEVAAPVVTIPLSRFLRPGDLPPAAPFARWTLAVEPIDTFAPPCGLGSVEVPDGVRVLQYVSSVSTVRGYQLVRSYPTFRRARAAAGLVADRVGRCQGDTDRVALEVAANGNGYQVVRVPGTPGGRVGLTTYSRAGRLVSLVWLTSDSPEVVTEKVARDLVSVSVRRLAGTPDAEPTEPAGVSPLSPALLRVTDAEGGATGHDYLVVAPGDDEPPLPLHPCDARARGVVDLEASVRYLGADGRLAVGQTLQIDATPREARGAYAGLRRDIDTCIRLRADGPAVRLDLWADFADDAAGWSYPRERSRTGAALGVGVVIVRVGGVIATITRFPAPDEVPAQARAATVALARVAVDRIRTSLPAYAGDPPEPGSGPVTVLPSAFRVAEEATSAWQVQTGENLLSRTTRRSAGWALDPCRSPAVRPSAPGRTDMVTVRRAQRELTEAVQVALYRSPRAAAAAVSVLESELTECSVTTPDAGRTQVVWTTQPLAGPGTGPGLLAIARTEIDGVQVPGSTHAVLFRAANALFLRVVVGENFPRPGQPDEITDLVAGSARENAAGICALVLVACD